MDHVVFSIVKVLACKMGSVDTTIPVHSQRLHSKERTHIEYIGVGMMVIKCASGELFWIIDGLSHTTHTYL
jgi:hypothetical protein